MRGSLAIGDKRKTGPQAEPEDRKLVKGGDGRLLLGPPIQRLL